MNLPIIAMVLNCFFITEFNHRYAITTSGKCVLNKAE